MTTSPYEKMNAYGTRQKDTTPGGSSRETDSRALIACAHRLKQAIENQGKDFLGYGDAVRHNQHLWTIFQVALCEPDNALPEDLKILLLNLSRYVDRVSFEAVTAYKPDLLQSMIDINMTIASGLSARPATSDIASTSSMMAPSPEEARGSIATSA